MANNRYIGARYVPIFAGAWDNTQEYEPLTIVSYQGDSYTSRGYVPTGIAITNTQYWAKTGDFNQQVANLQSRVQELENDTYKKSDYLIVTGAIEDVAVNTRGTTRIPDTDLGVTDITKYVVLSAMISEAENGTYYTDWTVQNNLKYPYAALDPAGWLTVGIFNTKDSVHTYYFKVVLMKIA